MLNPHKFMKFIHQKCTEWQMFSVFNQEKEFFLYFIKPVNCLIKRSKGCPKKSYVDLLEDYRGYLTNEVENSMLGLRLCQVIISARLQESTQWMSEWVYCPQKILYSHVTVVSTTWIYSNSWSYGHVWCNTVCHFCKKWACFDRNWSIFHYDFLFFLALFWRSTFAMNYSWLSIMEQLKP